MPIDQQAQSPALFKKQRGMMWARTFYLIGLAAALVFVLPTEWFPYQSGKVALFAFFLLLSVAAFSFSGGWRSFWQASGAKWALLVALLPLSYLLSAYVSGTLPHSYLGAGIDIDSIVFTTLAALAFVFSFALFRTSRAVSLLLSVTFYSLLAAVVFQLITITLGDAFIPFPLFSDPAVSLIGKWNDLGILVGLFLLLATIRLEFSTLSRVVKTGLLLCAVLALILSGFINFSLVWGLLITVLVILVLFKLLQSPIAPDEQKSLNWRQHIPWLSGAVAILLLGFLFFGNTINAWLTSYFPVAALEVRPSFSSTMDVIEAGRGDSFPKLLVGSGPTTFADTWIAQKPPEVNQSIFWNLDFISGFSTVITALGSVGIVGALMWLIAPLLVLFAFLRALRTTLFHSREKALALASAIGSIFLALVFIFYVPNQNLLLLTFTFMGATFGFLWRSAERNRDMEEVPSTRAAAVFRGFVALVFIALIFVSSVATTRRALSEVFVLRGQAAVNQGQTDAGLIEAGRASWFERTPNTFLLTVAAGFIKLQQIANDTSIPAETAQERFTATVNTTVAAGQDAVTRAPKDYRVHVLLGNVYAFLASLDVEGAYESALTSYKTAATLNPKNPEIPLAVARLEAEEGNLAAADAAVTEALTLKQNYTDAVMFVVQLAVANNDIVNAIRAAEVAVQTAPGVSSIWFQLGLLYYSNQDMARAALAFERALSITADYANAKYFLGLAYYNQNRREEAVSLFEDLQQTNPENTEVNLILENMRAGRPAFEGAEPPVTDTPEDRPEAPIEE